MTQFTSTSNKTTTVHFKLKSVSLKIKEKFFYCLLFFMPWINVTVVLACLICHGWRQRQQKRKPTKSEACIVLKKRFSLKRLVMLSASIVLPPRYISIIFTTSFSHDTCTCNNKLSAILSTLCLILFLIHVYYTWISWAFHGLPH